MSKKILSAINLLKSYSGRSVVNKVSIEVRPGEIVGLLGPNGAGKTTCFYMIAGLVRPDEGKIFLEGSDITSFAIHARAKRGIGYLPQEASVFRDLSVEENIYCALQQKKYSYRQKREKLNTLLKDFGLLHVKKSRGKDLSGGERRRVEIARTLAINPDFILLDEPFAGVDPLAVSDIQGIIRTLRNQGIGILITDHNVRETLGIVDIGHIMNQGELLLSGTPEEIVHSEKAKKFYLGEEFKM